MSMPIAISAALHDAMARTVCRWSGAVLYTPPAERMAPRFWTALEYSARESISLLQARSMPAIDTTGVGTILDFLLRLAGPVLLAFAILALRARTRR